MSVSIKNSQFSKDGIHLTYSDNTSQNVTFNNKLLTLDKELSVGGSASVGGVLTVTGVSNLNNKLNVSDDVKMDKQLTVGGFIKSSKWIPQRTIITNSEGELISSSITDTELNYIGGLTSGVQTQLNGKLNLTGGSLSGNLSMGTNKVTSSYTPVNTDDLTNKAYVDRAIGGTGSIKSSEWTPQKVMITNSTGELITSSITDTELSYLSGVSSNIQSQLNSKANTSDLANYALLAGNNNFTGSNSFVDNIQLDSGLLFMYGDAIKWEITKDSMTGDLFFYNSETSTNVMKLNLTNSNVNFPYVTSDKVAIFDSNKALVSSTVSTTTLGYLDATSSIQTQLNNKASTASLANYLPLAGGTLTGTVHNTGGSFWPYKGGDTNRGVHLFANDADGASYTSYNGGIGSWYGIGFYCSLDSTTRFIFDTRTGDSSQTGTKTCGALTTTGTVSCGSLNTTDNVGIGTSSPSYVLDVQSATAEYDSTMRIRTKWASIELDSTQGIGGRRWTIMSTAGGSGAGQGNFALWDNTGGAYRFVVTSSGNVGIGTDTTPTTRLDISPSGSEDNYVRVRVTSGTYSGISMTEDGWWGHTIRYNQATDSLLFSVQNGTPSFTDKMCLTYDGSLGIGTISPTTKLEVSGAGTLIGAINPSGGDNYSGMRIGNNTGYGCYWFLNSSERTGDGGTNTATLRNDLGKLRLQSGGGNGIMIDTSGNVGIGTTAPLCSLYNYEPGSGWKGMSYFGNETTGVVAGSYNNQAWLGGHNASLNAWTDLNLCQGGNLGVGGVNGNYKMNVEGTCRISSILSSGPNSQGKTLVVGASNTNYQNGDVGQVICTNGNIHIDAAGNQNIYLNYYQGTKGGIFSYGVWTHDSNMTASGSITAAQIYTNDFLRINNNNGGIYWQNIGRGIQSAEGAGNYYGTISNYGSGRNGYNGYGFDSRYCMMKNNTDGTIGLYDINYGWLFISTGNFLDMTISQSVRCSQDWDRFMVYRNGYDTSGGYFYVNQGGGYGMASDERLKENIETIPENKSIEFIKNLQPSSFCMKEQKECYRKNPDGKEELFTPSMCTCKEDGWIAQNVLESATRADIPKGVVNNWSDYQEQLDKPEEERTAILGVSDRPILSHTVNVVKHLLNKVDILEKRNQVLEEHARYMEDRLTNNEEQFTAYKLQNENLTAVNEAQNNKINELESIIVNHNNLLTQIFERLNNKT